MILDIWRKKLLTSMVHFAGETKRPTVVKMFKLLYFLDFKAIEEIGAPVTNLYYKALKWGPVPTQLYSEIGARENVQIPEDFREFLTIRIISDKHDFLLGNEFVARKEPDYRWLSKREFKVLQAVTEIYRNETPNDISMISHEPRGPWAKTWNKGKGENDPIKFELALKTVTENQRELALDGLVERHGLIKKHGLISIK